MRFFPMLISTHEVRKIYTSMWITHHSLVLEVEYVARLQPVGAVRARPELVDHLGERV